MTLDVNSRPLGRVFSDTTTSYKLFWFQALLKLAEQDQSEGIPLCKLFEEMVVAAWAPVMFYRLSLGKQDKLQLAVQELAEVSGLQTNASPRDVKRALAGWSEAAQRLEGFGRYVPSRFLTPWFEQELRGVPDGRRTQRIEQLSRESVGDGRSAPYSLEVQHRPPRLRLDLIWRKWILENKALLIGFGDQGLSAYLQDHNPSVPGIVRKLRVPLVRNLSRAHKFWRAYRDLVCSRGQAITDFYTGHPLEQTISIDHFLPWSFVAHDELWNLAPVTRKTNSSKGDWLPDLDIYVPRLAQLHHSAATLLAREHPRLLDNHLSLFGCDLPGLVEKAPEEIQLRYEQVLRPLAQIAANQGFSACWSPSSFRSSQPNQIAIP